MVIAADRIQADVAGAVARSYLRLGDTVIETTLAEISEVPDVPGMVVAAADLGAIECLLADDEDPELLVPGIERLAGTGWMVTLLAPAGRMGEAHRALRGHQARIQAWWWDGDQLCFGVPEVP